MDFGLSEDQQLLEETVRSFLADRVPIARVRELEERDTPNDPRIWSELAELGVAGILVPEAQGGSGLTLLDAALVFFETGRARGDSNLIESARRLLRRVLDIEPGHPAAQARLRDWRGL